MRYFIRTCYFFLISTLLLGALYMPGAQVFRKKSNTSLNLFVWGSDFIPSEVLAAFEEETGITINLNFYTSNEELIGKLRRVQDSSYDIVFPSDYAVKILANEGYLLPLDHEKLDFPERLTPFLLDRPYDKGNRYSYPYSLEIYGIAIDRRFKPPSYTPSLAYIFEPQKTHLPLVMTSDPFESLVIAAQYKFGRTSNLSPSEVQALKQLLKGQKKTIEAYADFRAKYLLTNESCHLAIIRSSAVEDLLEDNKNIDFDFPKEALLTTIENVAISASSKNKEAAYKFLNYIYRPEIMAMQINAYPFFPASSSCFPYVKGRSDKYFALYEEFEKRQDLVLFDYIIPSEQIREIWVGIKT